jgi:N4-gp56 family major capsid protein
MLNYVAGAAADSNVIDGAGSAQMNTFFYLKKALIEARKEQFFMPLASVENMPKHFGKTIKCYEYVPLLDDRNVNDQGLDAAGATIADGNLYGSSKDIGTITAKLPLLTENGGRVNRVGFTRLDREGSIAKFGFFTEFTQESIDFDSDSELMSHLSRELINGAHQLTEACLQKDLLSNAGVVIYSGAAVSNATMTGEGATPSLVEYADLMRLDQTLTDNRTPKQTKVITGSRLVDTKTIPSARVLYIGPELVPVVKGMTDLFGNPAFIPVQQYGDAGTILNGEIGTVDSFRIVEVPEMLHWADVGAAVTGANLGYRNTGGNYDVFPMLCVGSESFATIGFQTDGKTVKFSVLTKMPGRETADRNDPYGETGFSSIKWYYGFLSKRPERIGLIKTVAPL